MQCFDFAHEKMSGEDIDLFFNPTPEEHQQLVRFISEKNMSHILHWSGMFDSVNNARKNGWDKPIPSGWTDMTVGKGVKMRRICILNVF